ncbi:MAG: GNAT family N-acetyltransferase [Candidatus Zixiibacteriota bacterium]|nr:MAG: GNAT family N-acetyltransferase [candidate division Zixibacteria bacterium]
MPKKEIARLDRIALCTTTEDNLGIVIKMERDSNNIPFIRQWSEQKHRAAIANADIAHLIIQAISDSRIIGYVILIGLENPDESIEFKRIVIGEKGEGFGREAVRLVKKYAFEIRGAHRLWLEVIENNYRAYRLYKSEGFVSEGVHRESLKQGDTFLSLRVMSMLAGEYRHCSE